MSLLIDRHTARLAEIGVPADVAGSACYRSVLVSDDEEVINKEKKELASLGFPKVARVPGILITLLSRSGDPVGYQLLRDESRTTDAGTIFDREAPKDLNVVHWPTESTQLLENAEVPLFVTDDPLLADWLCNLEQPAIAIVQAGSQHLPDEAHQQIGKDRKVYCCVESRRKWVRGIRRLAGAANLVRTSDGQTITAVLAKDGVAELLKLVWEQQLLEGNYPIGPEGFEMYIGDDDDGEPKFTPLATFEARITKEIKLTGSDRYDRDTACEFEIQASVYDPTKGERVTHPPAVVPAEYYGAMKWLHPCLGSRANIHPVAGGNQHVALAITEHSDPLTVTIYTHTGWIRLPSGLWCYLHADGGVGKNGAIEGVETRLEGRLQHVVLEPGEVSTEDIEAMIRFLRLCPRTTIPLLAYVYRAALGWVNFTLLLYGGSGRFKTELVALAQAAFGCKFNSEFLLQGWNSTANSIERLLYCGKDLPVGVDDYRRDEHDPRGFCQVIRSQANGEGRGRLDRNARTKVVHDPRGGMMTSGEHLVGPLSILARMCAIRTQEGDIPIDDQVHGRSTALDQCKQDAAKGSYVRVMTRLLQWLAIRIEEAGSPLQLLTQLRSEVSTVRRAGGHHGRTAGIVGELEIGLLMFFRFLGLDTDLHAARIPIPEPLIDQLLEIKAEAEDCLDALYDSQAGTLRGKRPGVRFLESLRSALQAGRAYVASDSGGVPKLLDNQLSLLGYKKTASGVEARGEGIGRLCQKDGANYVALDVGAAQAVVRDFSRREGEPVDEDKDTILEDLDAIGALLVTKEERADRPGQFRIHRTHQVRDGTTRPRYPLLRLNSLLGTEQEAQIYSFAEHTGGEIEEKGH